MNIQCWTAEKQGHSVIVVIFTAVFLSKWCIINKHIKNSSYCTSNHARLFQFVRLMRNLGECPMLISNPVLCENVHKEFNKPIFLNSRLSSSMCWFWSCIWIFCWSHSWIITHHAYIYTDQTKKHEKNDENNYDRFC